jgi:hypothetical protein
MNCSRIGGECPHPIKRDKNFIFIVMPFNGYNSVYDIIQQSINSFGNKFTHERADEKYTNFSVWCKRICCNIRKASIIVADTTGKNANVFYELGFAHSIPNKKTIIVTQNIEDAPFDIKDIGHILYSSTDLPKLRIDLIKAITDINDEPEYDLNVSDGSIYSKEILKDLIKEEIFEDAVEKLFIKLKNEGKDGKI